MLLNFFQLDDEENALTCGDLGALEQPFQHANELINAKAERIQFPKRTRFFESKTFEKVKFNGSGFEEITFKNCIFKDCLFVGCEFYNVEFHDTNFKDCNFWKADFQRVYLDIRLVSFDRSYQKSHANVMLGFYQEIFDNYADAHQWKFSLFADIERRRWDRFQAIYEQSQIKWSTKTTLEKIKRRGAIAGNWVYDSSSRFGYAPFRFLLVTLALMAATSWGVYENWAVFGFSEAAQSRSFEAAFFYVVTVWSTLGYSSMIPTTQVGMLASSALGLVGLAWAGLFAAILIRRLIR